MPINSFTVGRDVQLTIKDPNGNTLGFALLTNFTASPKPTDKEVVGLDGRVRHVVFHKGWTGKFEYERQNNLLDNYWNALEAGYYAGLNQASNTITETITENDGSLTQYTYTNVIFKLDDAGDFKGDDTVKQTLSFMAERRLTVI